MKILITNTVALNTGDAAILKAIVKLLQLTLKTDIDFTVYDSQPEVAQNYYSDLKFRHLIYWQSPHLFQIKRPVRLIRYLNRLRIESGVWFFCKKLFPIANFLLTLEELKSVVDYQSADLILSTGGTYLVENYFLAPRILDYQITLALKKPLIFFTQSLGPFSNPKHQRAFRQIFDRALLILLRDFQSQKHLMAIGVQNEQMYVAPDVVFALANLQALDRAIQNSFSPSPKIAISVRFWKHFKTIEPALGQANYFQSIRALVTHLISQYNAQITFISTCQGIPEYYLDDSQAAQEIVGCLPESVQSAIAIDTEFHSPETLMEILDSYDLTIATRMHMAILSLSAGVPVFPIAYEFKTKELFDNLGQGQWTIDIEKIQPELLIQSVDQFIRELPTNREKLFVAVREQRNRVFESAELVRELLESSP